MKTTETLEAGCGCFIVSWGLVVLAAAIGGVLLIFKALLQ